ncbi:MAG: prolyl oligopeptidase family serine peptidase, partial [Pirellulaceae bacterium]
PDSLDRMEPYYTPPQWLPDGSGFLYSRLRLLPAEALPTEGYKRSRTFLHRLGHDIDDDPVVFAMDLWPGVSMTEEDFPSIVLTSGSDYAIGKIKHGDANQLTLYAAPLSSIATSNTPWKMICDVADSVTDFAVHGNEIYLKTSRLAPRFKIVKSPLAKPGFASAIKVIPTSDVVVEGMAAAKDALYVSTYSRGITRIMRIGYGTGEATLLKLPDNAPAGHIDSTNPLSDGFLFSPASWTRRSGTYSYDPETNAFTDTGLNPSGKFDNVPGYESVEVQVLSHDRVMVPLSIVFKSGLKRDGSNPTLLGGYGSYGHSMDVSFRPTRLAWLERGGIVAVAHVRGGGEYGQEWHMGGQKLTKPNTWKDFIACAEYLIAEGYTSPEKLAGKGGSAGGILIGRAITERPDLFAAALLNVGCLDAIRMETTTNGIPNIQEFGTVAKEDEFHALLEMSSYHHVTDGVVYPAVM